ncbi:MAG: Na+/H+ antiporter subunit E [Clostridiaceae bacterium]
MINKIYSFVLLFVLWTFLSFPLNFEKSVVGIILSSFILLALSYFTNWEGKFNFKKLFNFSLFFLRFIFELVKANFIMAKIVITPSLPILPKIIKVKTSIKSNVGRAYLANAITLTPGTLSVDLIEDEIYVHVVEGVKLKDSSDIIKPFEKRLKGAFDN